MKGRPRFVMIAVCITVFLLIVGVYGWFFWSPIGSVVGGPHYEGLLISASTSPSRFGPWTPTRAQISEMEVALAEYVPKHENEFGQTVLAMLPQYRRCYQGGTIGGQRLIIVNFYAPEIVSRRVWLNGIIIDGDSRENNWEIQFDPVRRVFTTAYPFKLTRKGL